MQKIIVKTDGKEVVVEQGGVMAAPVEDVVKPARKTGKTGWWDQLLYPWHLLELEMEKGRSCGRSFGINRFRSVGKCVSF